MVIVAEKVWEIFQLYKVAPRVEKTEIFKKG